MLTYAGPDAQPYMEWLDLQTRGTRAKSAAKKAEKKKK
jgi:hypothetical protein